MPGTEKDADREALLEEAARVAEEYSRRFREWTSPGGAYNLDPAAEAAVKLLLRHTQTMNRLLEALKSWGDERAREEVLTLMRQLLGQLERSFGTVLALADDGPSESVAQAQASSHP